MLQYIQAQSESSRFSNFENIAFDLISTCGKEQNSAAVQEVSSIALFFFLSYSFHHHHHHHNPQIIIIILSPSLCFGSSLGFILGPPILMVVTESWSKVYPVRSPLATFSKFPLFWQFHLVIVWVRASKPIFHRNPLCQFLCFIVSDKVLSVQSPSSSPPFSLRNDHYRFYLVVALLAWLQSPYSPFSKSHSYSLLPSISSQFLETSLLLLSSRLFGHVPKRRNHSTESIATDDDHHEPRGIQTKHSVNNCGIWWWFFLLWWW